MSSRSALAPQEFASPFLSAVPALVPSHRSSSGRASSSSASTTSSPATSPWASSQAVLGTSPPALSLPPQAYPIAQPSPKVEPVKIPPQIFRAPASLDGHSSRGDETLKFHRRPGPTSHLTSPLALFPLANPSSRKSYSGAHSNAGNSPRLSPMLSPLMAPVKPPKGSQKLVRCDRPGCTLLHTALYGRNQLGFKSDVSIPYSKQESDDADTIGHFHHSDEDDDFGRPSPSHTHSAFASIPAHDRTVLPPPHRPHEPPHSPYRSASSPPGSPPFIRRASVPNNTYSSSISSFPSSLNNTPVSRVPSDSSDHSAKHPSPLAQPPDTFSPDRRGRSRQRSQSGERRESDRERERESSSRGRDSGRVSGRSSRSRTRGDESRGRRGGEDERGRRVPDEREENTPRGRRSTSRMPNDDHHHQPNEQNRDETCRGRSGSRRRSRSDENDAVALGAEVDPSSSRSRSVSVSPDYQPAGATGTRGRRPTVTVKPSPFTMLSSNGVVRTVGQSQSRSRDREEDDRRTDDARGRMRSMRIEA